MKKVEVIDGYRCETKYYGSPRAARRAADREFRKLIGCSFAEARRRYLRGDLTNATFVGSLVPFSNALVNKEPLPHIDCKADAVQHRRKR